jgi:hypothetical protein
LEQDSKLAIKTIQVQLQTQGAQVVLDGKEFEKSIGKLIDVYQLYRLACAVGLGAFAEEIVTADIKRRFLRPPGSTPAVPMVVSGESE